MSFRIPILSVALTIVATAPIWLVGYIVRPNLWETDDGSGHLYRALAMSVTTDRIWGYPRWAPDYFIGYGYPVFNYYSPLTYLYASLLHKINVSIYNAFDAIGVFAVILGALGVSACIRAFWPSKSAYVNAIATSSGAIAFAAAPYPFIVNLHIRGDLPEALGIAILPWFILAIHRAWIESTTSGKARGLIAGTIGALLIGTHALSAVIAFACAVIWVSCLIATGSGRIRWGAFALLVGGLFSVGITSWLTLPMGLERTAVHVEEIKFPIEGVLETLSSPFGVGRAIAHPGRSPYGDVLSSVDWQFAFRYPWGPPGWDGPVKPGAVQIAILAIASFGILITLISGRWVASHPVQIVSQSRPMSLRSDRAALAGSFIIVAAAWFLNTNWSSFIWFSIDALRWLQFPSRLYGPFSMGVGLIIGCAISRSNINTYGKAVLSLTAGGTLLASTFAHVPFPLPGSMPRPVTGSTLVEAEYARDTWQMRLSIVESSPQSDLTSGFTGLKVIPDWG